MNSYAPLHLIIYLSLEHSIIKDISVKYPENKWWTFILCFLRIKIHCNLETLKKTFFPGIIFVQKRRRRNNSEGPRTIKQLFGNLKNLLYESGWPGESLCVTTLTRWWWAFKAKVTNLSWKLFSNFKTLQLASLCFVYFIVLLMTFCGSDRWMVRATGIDPRRKELLAGNQY